MSRNDEPDTSEGFVILHFGPMGVESMSKATKLAGRDDVIDTDAARMAGASFAFGAPKALDALKKRLTADAVAAAREEYPDLPPEAISWLAQGERGMSAEAIFTRLSGKCLEKGRNNTAHPHDPADLRRCRLLLDSVPAFSNRIAEMATVSPAWAGLVATWDRLCATMDAEVPEWRDGHGGAAPDTYAMIRQATGSR